MAKMWTEASGRRGRLLLLLGDGTLMLCAMGGFALSFLTVYTCPAAGAELSALYRYVQTGGGLAALLWAVAAALVSLAVWSLPRFRLAAAGGLTAAWAAWLYYSWEEFCLGAKLAGSAIADMFAWRVGWIDPMNFDPGLTVREEGDAIQLFLLLSLSLLALAVGWAVVRGRRWWLAALLTLPPLLPGLVADLYPSWPAFMALCACWCVMLFTDLCRWAAPDRRGALTLAVLPCVGAVLLVLSLVMPMEGYARPQWALDAETAAINWGNRNLAGLAEIDWPFTLFDTGSSLSFVGAAETVDLTKAGPLSYSGRTVLRVTTDYEGRLYLRGASLAAYDGQSWSALPEGTYQEYLDQLDSVNLPTPLAFLSLSSGRGITHTATVENLGASGACVYTPYQMLNQDWNAAGMMPVEDAYFAHAQGQWEHTMTFEPLQLHEGMFDSKYIRAYEEYVSSHYLDVPHELWETLYVTIAEQNVSMDLEQMALDIKQALMTSGDVNGAVARSEDAALDLTFAVMIGRLLDELCEYDANTPLTPEGEDFVEYFLTESHRGYCMHFASAAALLLRAMGIPARYVSGFTVEAQPGRQMDVADRAAHAWVEVYLSGYGWYPVEVTPAAAFETPAVPVPGDIQPSDELPSQPPEESEGPAPTETETPAPSADLPVTGDGDGPGSAGFSIPAWVGTAAKGLLMAVCVAAVIWLGQYLPKRIRRVRMEGDDPNRAALEAYRCLRRLEKWGGDVEEANLELARKARFSQHALAPEEVRTMTGAFDAQRARLCIALSPLERLAFLYLWGRPEKSEQPEDMADRSAPDEPERANGSEDPEKPEDPKAPEKEAKNGDADL